MISDEQLSTMPLAELRELYGKIGARIEALLSEEKASTIRKVQIGRASCRERVSSPV